MFADDREAQAGGITAKANAGESAWKEEWRWEWPDEEGVFK